MGYQIARGGMKGRRSYDETAKDMKTVLDSWNRFYCILELLSQNQAHDCREQYAQWEAFYSINHSKTFRFMIPS
jgi:hypothetical protein